MRSAFVCVLLVAMGAAFGREEAAKEPSPIVFLLPDGKGSSSLRLDLVNDGRSPVTDWEAFLRRLFDHFDRDADGSLSRAEASRMMPLPLPGGKELNLDFAKLDTDRDGKVSRAELKAFCLRSGFTPTVPVVAPPSADDGRLAALLSSRLGEGGKLTTESLRRAPRSLSKFDLDDDESLGLDELLAGAGPAALPGPSRVKVAPVGAKADVVLRLDLGRKAGAKLVGKDAGGSSLSRSGREDSYRLRGSAGAWWVMFRTSRQASDMGAARSFLVAQFEEAMAGRKSLSKAELSEDATLTGFLDLLPFADRNGDDRLDLTELKGYLNLVESAMRAQVWVTATDRQGNPFPFLDRDGDGKLSRRELGRAPTLLGGRAERIGLPMQFELSFGGPPVKSWGGVAVPAPKPPVFQKAAADKGPAWFRAMDRNGDGVVSRREFLGPPEVFRRLDADGDGVITAAEAKAAGIRPDPAS